MVPIFDRNAQLVGWFDGEHVFDTGMSWVAFQSSGNLFSAKTSAWLGQLIDGSLNDRQGKPVAWLESSSPKGTLAPLAPMSPLRPLTPLRPLKPLRPLTPLTPLAPLGGWSGLDWQAWLG